MRTKVMFSVVAVILLCGVALAEGPVSLLPGGFLESVASTERWLTSRPSFPSLFGSAPAEGEIELWVDSSVQRNNPLSLAIRATSDRWRPSWHIHLYSSSGVGNLSPLHIPIEAGDAYDVTLYYKVGDDWTPRVIEQTGQVEVRVEATYLNQGTRVLGLIDSLEPVGEPVDGWQKIFGTVTLPSIPDGMAYDRIRFDLMSVYARGTVWFTDVEIVKRKDR